MADPVNFWLDFWHVLTLRSGYNATLVILGTTSLGIASGIVDSALLQAFSKFWKVALAQVGMYGQLVNSDHTGKVAAHHKPSNSVV